MGEVISQNCPTSPFFQAQGEVVIYINIERKNNSERLLLKNATYKYVFPSYTLEAL